MPNGGKIAEEPSLMTSTAKSYFVYAEEAFVKVYVKEYDIEEWMPKREYDKFPGGKELVTYSLPGRTFVMRMFVDEDGEECCTFWMGPYFSREEAESKYGTICSMLENIQL
jgi:hypothetical protein